MFSVLMETQSFSNAHICCKVCLQLHTELKICSEVYVYTAIYISQEKERQTFSMVLTLLTQAGSA